MSNYRNRAYNVLQRINDLAEISEHPTNITRTFGTPAFIEGCRKVALWMLEAGLETRIDNIGNVRGRYNCNIPGAKTFVIASHIDTVINAGKFDGPLGVIAGLDILQNIIETDTRFPFDIELIAFSDEEGVRFHTTFLGSKVLAGNFDKNMLELKDQNGIYLKSVLKEMNCDTAQIQNDAIKSSDLLGYFEIHIEQGPVLDELKIPVGVVTGIAGQKRIEITFEGFAGHAGTVPMDYRQDSLCCAASFILSVESAGLKHKEKIVATVGKLEVLNAASNVIPGKVICSLDMRSTDSELLNFVCNELENNLHEIAKKRNISAQWKLIQETQPVICDEKLNTLIGQSIQQINFPLINLVSGAGHDAVTISNVAPVSMLFVRCDKGISHNPLENTSVNDIAAALEVSENFIRSLQHIN